MAATRSAATRLLYPDSIATASDDGFPEVSKATRITDELQERTVDNTKVKEIKRDRG